MDYTAFGFAGLCVLVAVLCAVVAAHRGGTMKLNLPFITFDGEGLGLTRGVRSFFAVLAFAVLGIALAWILVVVAPGKEGAFQASTAPTSGPTVTATVTVPMDRNAEDNRDEQRGDARTSTDDDASDTGAADQPSDLVQAWVECPFALHYESVLSVEDDSCPVVTADSAQVTMDYDISDDYEYVAALEVNSGAYLSAWPKDTVPSPEQCRAEVEAGGVRGGTVWIDSESAGNGVCIRTSSGERYVYLRFEQVAIESGTSYAISGTASAWDVG